MRPVLGEDLGPIDGYWVTRFHLADGSFRESKTHQSLAEQSGDPMRFRYREDQAFLRQGRMRLIFPGEERACWAVKKRAELAAARA